MTPTILIVEDSELGSQLVEILELEGLAGIRGMNALEGLQLAQEHQPDVIFTDLMMPQIDGFEFIQRLHDNPAIAHIPVIVMSAAVDRGANALEAGAAGFLAKPFMNAEFLAAIQQVLSG
jgi:CheY-like chemotaxis protein